MDTERIKQLIAKREEIDRELIELVTGGSKKAVRCSVCGEEGHTARTCAKKPPAASPAEGGAGAP